MWQELASDLSRSGLLSLRIVTATEVRGYGGVAVSEREGVISNEGGGVHPHTSSSLIRYEGVGHVNWTVTYNTMADKEGGSPPSIFTRTRQNMATHNECVSLDLFLRNLTFT